jgi:PAS domain S-box-containing protein
MSIGSWSKRALFGCGLLLAGLPVLALDPGKSIHQFNCQNWTRQTGLPVGRINAIAQTKDGFLWLGAQQGLVRFDGVAFTLIPLDESVARGREVRSLAASRRGDLLMAIYNGVFVRFDGAKLTAIDDPSWPRANFTSKTIMEARNGTLWAGANLGVGCAVPGAPAAGYFVDTQPGRVWTICDDVEGRIWAGLDNGSLLCLTKGARMAVDDPALAHEIINALAADGSGHLWVGGAKALRRYDGEGRPTDLPVQLTEVNALLLDRHGVLWVGTEREGLFRYHEGRFTNLRAADGLVSDHITALCEDAEGSLWVGTRDGLSQLSDVKFPVFTEKDGLVPGSGHMVAASRRGGLWFASSQGVCRFDGRKTTDVIGDTVLTDRYVKQVAEGPNGDVYLTDGKLNLDVLVGDRPGDRYACPKWPEALAVDDEGVLVGLGRTLMRARDGKLLPYAFAEGQETDFQWFDHLYVARDGAIWLPAYSGIYRIKEGRTQRFLPPDARPADRLHFLMEDVDGSIWVASSVGLIRIKDGRLRRITMKDGLGDNHIYALVADDHGYFWLDSSRGILRAARQSLNDFADGRATAVVCEVYEGLEAVKYNDRTDQEYSGCKTADGRIWFPNVHGVLMIDPTNFFTNKIAPPVLIENVRVDGRVQPGRESLVLPGGAKQVEFFFTVPSFIAPQKIRVRYRLEGLDETWVEAGARRSVLYSGLRPGRYTFRVQACNSDGVWNTVGAVCTFERPRRFHETAWFHALCGLAGLAVLLGAYRWKVRLMVRRQRKLQAAHDQLEAKVAERTGELAFEQGLLRTLLDNLPDKIYFKDTQSRFVRTGKAQAQTLGAASPAEVIGRTDFDYFGEKHARQAFADEQEVMRTGQPLLGKVEQEDRPDGRVTWALTSKIPWRDKDGKIIGTFGVSKDITAIKEAQRAVEELHKQLVETSRQAGMAEVATSVLHNVGNVLNSVNVSATLVGDRLRASKVANLPKLVAMLQDHAADLADFLANDPKGRAITPYLASLGGELVAEQGMLLKEIEELRKNIEHIKEIVAMQQSYAKVSGLVEAVPLAEIVEDAIRINAGALDRHQVTLVRDYAARPTLTLERHKVMQILVNLIRNAKYACDDGGRPDKTITIRLAQEDDWVRLSVIDNGIGIPPENLTRIFGHGFTTRKEGHGFGLHSGSLTAKELGGSLVAHSDGPGTGATFTLNLPLPPPEK